MLKKILSSMATLTLIAGSATTTTAWTEHKSQNNGNTQKQNSQSSQDYNIKDPNLFAKIQSIPEDNPINSTYVYKNVFYVGTKSGLYESNDDGKTFTQNSYCDYNITKIYAYNDIVYVGTKSNGLWESNDYGATFTQNVYLYDKSINTIYAYNDVVYLGCATFWIYESTDNGQTWKHLDSMPSGDPTINTIYVYNGVIYAGVSGNLFDEGDLWESTDNGVTFYSITYMSNLSINTIYAYNGVIYVGTNKGVWRSTDKGQTFSQAYWFPSGDVSIHTIYFYKNAIYVGTNIGLYEADYYLNPFFIQKTSIPVDDIVSSIHTYNNILYAGTNTDLYGLGTTIATINPPNEILSENTYFAYNHPINFAFDWTLLSQATIINNSTSTSKTKTLTSGSYQIKDDGNYTVTFTSKIGGNKYTNTFFLKNGYDFSHGINGLTFNKGSLDASGNQTYDLDLYINGFTASQLMSETGQSSDPHPLDNLLDVLTNPATSYMGSKAWKDSFSNQTLKTSAINDGKTMGGPTSQSTQVATGDLYDYLTSGNDSILNRAADVEEASYTKYRKNLFNNVSSKNISNSKQIGVNFHFNLEYVNKWNCTNFHYGVPNDAYNQIIQSQPH